MKNVTYRKVLVINFSHFMHAAAAYRLYIYFISNFHFVLLRETASMSDIHDCILCEEVIVRAKDKYLVQGRSKEDFVFELNSLPFVVPHPAPFPRVGFDCVGSTRMFACVTFSRGIFADVMIMFARKDFMLT